MTMNVAERFCWQTIDVNSLLEVHKPGWREDTLRVATAYAMREVLKPPHSTTREAASEVPIWRVPGAVVERELPWLISLYENELRELGEHCTGQKLTVGSDLRHRMNINVQRRYNDHAELGRFDGHLDTNPVECLVYATDQQKGSGGALRVANNRGARDIAEIDADYSAIYPVVGHAVYFDGRHNPHYVDPLVDPVDLRAAIAANYYTAECTEAMRPLSLDDYLSGQKVN